MKHSCGAIFYTYLDKEVNIVLGKEGDWFPFKGRKEKGETNEECAVREIYEETLEMIKIDPNDIDLKCNFSTKSKKYHIGLIEVSNDFAKSFNKKRIETDHLKEKYPHLYEKSEVGMFPLSKLYLTRWHSITYRCIEFFLPILRQINRNMSQIATIDATKISPNDGNCLDNKKPSDNRKLLNDKKLLDNNSQDSIITSNNIHNNHNHHDRFSCLISDRKLTQCKYNNRYTFHQSCSPQYSSYRGNCKKFCKQRRYNNITSNNANEKIVNSESYEKIPNFLKSINKKKYRNNIISNTPVGNYFSTRYNKNFDRNYCSVKS